MAGELMNYYQELNLIKWMHPGLSYGHSKFTNSQRHDEDNKQTTKSGT